MPHSTDYAIGGFLLHGVAVPELFECVHKLPQVLRTIARVTCNYQVWFQKQRQALRVRLRHTTFLVEDLFRDVTSMLAIHVLAILHQPQQLKRIL